MLSSHLRLVFQVALYFGLPSFFFSPMPCPSHPSLFDHPTNSCCELRTKKLFTCNCLRPYVPLLLAGPKSLLSNQFCNNLSRERSRITPTQNYKCIRVRY
jgi:hypothetical protein